VASDKARTAASGALGNLRIETHRTMELKAEYTRGIADACSWVVGLFTQPPKLK
jgi:hypothetical protein